MTFKRFEEIEAWKRGMTLAGNVYRISSSGKFDKDWSLRDQMRRAAISIPSNIAEGFERNSESEFHRFLLIAKGSCGELRTQLMLSNNIGYLSDSEAELLIGESIEISSMIAGLIKFIASGLKKSNQSPKK